MHARPAGPIRSIQVLRAIAACAVVFVHATNRAQNDIGLHSDVASALAGIANSGVDLFFLISGFLMTHLHREQFGCGASLMFLRRRIERIVPLYWLLSGLAIALFLVSPRLFASVHQMSAPWLLGNFLFFPWPLPDGTMEHILVVGWTLDYEMYFYVLFAIAMIFRRGLAILAAYMLASYVLGVVVHPHHPWPQLLTDGLLLEFLAGAGIAILYSRIGASGHIKWVAWALIAAGVLLLGASLMVTGPRQWKWGVPLALVLLGTLWSAVRCEGRVARAVTVVGDASFSIYLFQVFALPAIGILLRHAGGRAISTAAAIAIYWVLGCAAGVACWYVLERPVGRWIKNNRGRSRQIEQAPAPSN